MTSDTAAPAVVAAADKMVVAVVVVAWDTFEYIGLGSWKYNHKHSSYKLHMLWWHHHHHHHHKSLHCFIKPVAQYIHLANVFSQPFDQPTKQQVCDYLSQSFDRHNQLTRPQICTSVSQSFDLHNPYTMPQLCFPIL